MDDTEARPQNTYLLGQDLYDMSVEELDATVILLEEEITRIREARTEKAKQMNAAEALFSKS